LLFRREQLTLLAWLLLAYLVSALFLAWMLVNHDYEAEYLALGNLVVRGELSLYQDEMRGQWVPLPFYVYGLFQAVFGPSLLAARLLSIALGGVVLVLVFVLANRWGGALAGTVAGALFCTQGLVLGYFSTVHFAGLVALLHLLGIYVLFCTDWPRRDLLAMAIVSVLFLVKPNYWPTIALVWLFLVWRAGSGRERIAITSVALAIPVVFFASDPDHVKLFAYVPILRDWVEPLGYRSWYSLTEDAAHAAASDYVDIPWETSFWGRTVPVLKTIPFILKRYAVWMTTLAGLAALLVWRARGAWGARGLWGPPGVRFTFWMFWYVVAAQFVMLGPYSKQTIGFVGAVAPLLAVAIGWLFAVVWERQALPRPARIGLAGGLVLALVVSPWVHRTPILPRTVSWADATIPVLRRAADRMAALIPPGEKRVFSIADPMPVYLANRQTYLQQFSQHKFVFTSLRDRTRYARVGMWGPSELEEWLGSDAQYAILELDVVRFYRSRAPYREILAGMDALLEENFTLVETVKAVSGDAFLIYRRRSLDTRGTAALRTPGDD